MPLLHNQGRISISSSFFLLVIIFEWGTKKRKGEEVGKTCRDEIVAPKSEQPPPSALTFCLMSRTRRSSDVPAAVVGLTAPPVPPPLVARSNFTLSKLISGALRLPSRGCPHPLNTYTNKRGEKKQ